MAPSGILNTPAMRKQRLLVEFAGLKTASVQGVFMSLTPGDPTLWTGVIFVRRGPYAPAVLRFQISFPPMYPTLPPLVTFSTDIFHPLLTPLTTQTYTTDIQDSGTVSATDNERLPPGGFSLRHGFPHWFGRANKRNAGQRQTSGQHSQKSMKSPSNSPNSRYKPPGPSSPILAPSKGYRTTDISAYEVLHYIRTTFDDACVLDSVPLEAAGNPGAWHAWRTYRLKSGVVVPILPPKDKETPQDDDLSEAESTEREVQKGAATTSLLTQAARKPGEWNWDGVWEVRSKRGIEGSSSEPVLYGNTSTNEELIGFLNVDEDQLATFQEKLRSSLQSL